MTLILHADPVPLRVDEAGTARVGHSRVTLDTVIQRFHQGDSPETLAQSFASLPLADVYAVIGYYLRHRAEVDAYLLRQEREADAFASSTHRSSRTQRLFASASKPVTRKGPGTMLRLLTDENFDGRITAGLLQLEPTLPLVRVQDVGLAAADDPNVLAWAAAEDRLLLTHDRKTIPGFAIARLLAGQRMPGVVVVAASCPLRAAIDALFLLTLASFPGEWEGQILSVP